MAQWILMTKIKSTASSKLAILNKNKRMLHLSEAFVISNAVVPVYC